MVVDTRCCAVWLLICGDLRSVALESEPRDFETLPKPKLHLFGIGAPLRRPWHGLQGPDLIPHLSFDQAMGGVIEKYPGSS